MSGLRRSGSLPARQDTLECEERNRLREVDVACLEVHDLMTPSPGWCTTHDPVETAARMMAEYDCGAVPVVDDPVNRRAVGVLPDRDIVLRMIVPGLSAIDCQVGALMTPNPVTLHASALKSASKR